MSAAAVAAGAMAVSSENIVGVVEREDGVDGYNWTCGTFDAVGGGNFSINDITLNDGGQYYISDNCLQVLDADGYTDEDYYYQEISTGVFQWNDGNGDPADRVFSASEGFLIENLDSIKTIIAGQVPETDVVRDDGGDGYNWYGNPYPQTISITDITLDDGGQYYISDNCLQVLDADAYTDEDYYYQEISTGVFQWNDGNGDPADRDFAASEGFLIENLDSIEVTIAKPYSL